MVRHAVTYISIWLTKKLILALKFDHPHTYLSSCWYYYQTELGIVSIFILDYPNTPLDSTDSNSVVLQVVWFSFGYLWKKWTLSIDLPHFTVSLCPNSTIGRPPVSGFCLF